MGDWSNLSKDLLGEISKRFTINADFVQFHAVCRLWRSAFPERPHHLPCQLPWLMLPYKDDHTAFRGFFSLEDSKVNWLELPEAYGKLCCGSSHGWLVLVDEETTSISLLNPLTRAQIQLPPITTFPTIVDFGIFNGHKKCLVRDCYGNTNIITLEELSSFYLQKVILSKNPALGNYIALAIFGEVSRLAFYRSGDEKWTIIEEDVSLHTDLARDRDLAGLQSYHNPFVDIIYHKGQFYALTLGGRVVFCDIMGHSPKAITIKQLAFFFSMFSINGIFGRFLWRTSDGEVTRHGVYTNVKYEDGNEVDSLKTSYFELFKQNHNNQWVEVKSLGNSMFLGGNYSLALSAKAFPGCKANRIYFTEDNDWYNSPYKGHDLGSYNLEDGSIEPFLCHIDKSKLGLQLAIWVTPSLH